MGLIRDNPILWREATPRFFRRISPRVRTVVVAGLGVVAIGGGVAVYLAGATGADETRYTIGIVVAWTWAGATLLLVPARAARSVVHERRQGTWDAVVLTRLRPAEIVFGKVLGALAPFWAVGILLLPAFAALALRTPDLGELAGLFIFVALTYGAAVVGGFCLASLGFYVSLRTSSVVNAYLWTYVPILAVGHLAALVGLIIFPILLLDFRGAERQGRGQ